MPSNTREGKDGHFDPPRTPPEVREADGAVVNRSTPAETAAEKAKAKAAAEKDAAEEAERAAAEEEPAAAEEVLFRCEAAPDLTLILPRGGPVKFAGQFFRTRDPAIAEEMRELIDDPGITVLFEEEDIDPVMDCPYCDFSNTSFKDLKAHIRAEHKGERIPQLRDLV